MPIINLKVSGTEDAGLAQLLAASLTRLTQTYLNKVPSVTAVTVAFIAENLWFINSQPIENTGKRSFYLDIKITELKNTADEKSAYIDAVYKLLETSLGGIHPESYVYVEEVKANAYGFGGLTQKVRFKKPLIKSLLLQ